MQKTKTKKRAKIYSHDTTAMKKKPKLTILLKTGETLSHQLFPSRKPALVGRPPLWAVDTRTGTAPVLRGLSEF